MRPTLPRLFAALPDAMTASCFATTWAAPAINGPGAVTRLTEVMLMEFLIVHSTVFYALIAAASDVARGRRLAWLTGLSGFYLLFALGFSLADQSTWPLFAFAWLFISRFAHIWTRPLQSSVETSRMVKLWLLSVGAYLFGAFVTTVLPLPRFGMTPAFVASLHINGSGEWDTRPQTVLAFGVLYFSIQAWAKYVMAGAAQPSPTAPAEPDILAQRISRIARIVTRETPKS